ncbi:MAG TPA: GntG family PLP-dependent aldolase [Chitinophagaceae bacterium]|nr:GntG family PLP-dependent aldolase [Chitinophagaceae bacterium]
MLIDLRSDTFTKPTPGMMQAITKADVGDDVFGEDPAVNALEEKAAALFGMEAALYCPTGTMSNQVAIKCHTQPGDEVICDKTAHVYQYEGGGIAFNSGAQVNTLDGINGRFTADQVLAAINNPYDVHKARTSLVCVENTSNRGGGGCYTINDIIPIRKVCDEYGLALHLDGARLFNALVAKNEKPEQYGEIFHTVSVCLNKGLGCPIGSILIGKKDLITKGRRIRKAFGGGMRQAGYMAAAGIYALDNHIERLAEDHHHAKQIAAALQEKDFTGEMLPVETNIILFTVKNRPAKELVEAFRQQGVLVIAMTPVQIRMVLHLDISSAMVKKVIDVIRAL